MKYVNKKVIGAAAAGLFALSVMGVGAGLGIGTVSAHDPAEHKDPAPVVEVDAAPVTNDAPAVEILSSDSAAMTAKYDKLMRDAGFEPHTVCKGFGGSLTANADAKVLAASGARVDSHPWDSDFEDSDVSLSVTSAAEGFVCSSVGVKHSISGTGFSEK